MRLESFSELVLGLSIIGCFSGCGPRANQQADAAPMKSAANVLPNLTPQETAAEAAEPLDEDVRKPATAAEAAAAIDLSTFPLLPGAVDIRTKTIACLEYAARLKAFDVRYEYEFQRRNLLERQWKELPNSDISAGYADGRFVHSGFHLYVTVQFHDEPGKVLVRLQNDSNVNVRKLPVPPGAKLDEFIYNIASYETNAGVEKTRDAVRKLLTDQGWKVMGKRGNALILKQNAVELTADVEARSAKPGKTRIAYRTAQMSADSEVPAYMSSIEDDVHDMHPK